MTAVGFVHSDSLVHSVRERSADPFDLDEEYHSWEAFGMGPSTGNHIQVNAESGRAGVVVVAAGAGAGAAVVGAANLGDGQELESCGGGSREARTANFHRPGRDRDIEGVDLARICLAIDPVPPRQHAGPGKVNVLLARSKDPPQNPQSPQDALPPQIVDGGAS